VPYAAASDVGSFCLNLLGNAGSTFTTATNPTLGAVNSWLTSGCAVLETQLGSHGYSTPVASTVSAYGWLTNLNALYAAARAEMSRANVSLRVGERTRGQVFDKMFWDELKRLLDMDLTMAGISRSATGVVYVGGISVADKDTHEDDSDRVPPRFTRAQFAFPETIRPDGTSAS